MTAPDLDRPRGPADLRDMLEVRVRRQSSSYPEDVQADALREARRLIDARLAVLEGRS